MAVEAVKTAARTIVWTSRRSFRVVFATGGRAILSIGTAIQAR